MSKMIKLLSTGLLATVLAASAFAGPKADALGACLADSTTGKERKELARWIFVGMSQHPEIKALGNVKPADMEASSKAIAGIFGQLLGERCTAQTKAAVQAEGNQALEIGFGMLGQMAMQELMADYAVKGALSDFQRYVDPAKVQAATGR